MSSDTRETCEALGRALDVDHVRAAVRDDERKDAVMRLRDSGAVVAALGHLLHDEQALAAADVSVALSAAGKSQGDPAIALVGDDVRDATLGLALVQQGRRRALGVLALTLGPALVGSLVVAAGMLAPEFAPVAGLVGALCAVWQLASDDRGAGS